MAWRLVRSAVICGMLPVSAIAIAILQIGCTSKEPSADADTGSAAERPNEAVAPDTTDRDSTAITAWLSDRYGPQSGIIEYEVTSSGQKTRQTWYFDQHGLREARYWRLDEGANPLMHITIVDNGNLIVLGPGDPEPIRGRWRPDPNTALPNFRHLTPEMRQMFSLQELPEKTVLEKKCSGYRLTIGDTRSDVWVWEGVMLYGEIQGTADGEVEPIVMKALSLETDVPIPGERFRIESDR